MQNSPQWSDSDDAPDDRGDSKKEEEKANELVSFYIGSGTKSSRTPVHKTGFIRASSL